MPYRRIDTASKSKARGLLHAHWTPSAVADKIGSHMTTTYRWERRIQMYGTINPPYRLHRGGRPPRMSTLVKKSMLEYQKNHPWVYQDELALYVEEEWGIAVNRATICRVLQKERISRKKGQRIGPQSRRLVESFASRPTHLTRTSSS